MNQDISTIANIIKAIIIIVILSILQNDNYLYNDKREVVAPALSLLP